MRTQRCLYGVDINTVDELENFTENNLLRIPGFGRKALKEVLEACEIYGIELLNHKADRLRLEYTRLFDQMQSVSSNNVAFIAGRKKGIEIMRFEG